MARCSHRLVKTTLVDARHGDRLEHSLPSSQSFWAFNFQAFSKSAWSCPESGCMKSNVLSLGCAVAVLRRIGGARRLYFQWTGGQHESQHDFDFLLKCLGHSHVEPAVEEGSSHFSCQSCVLWGKTMYEKFSGDFKFLDSHFLHVVSMQEKGWSMTPWLQRVSWFCCIVAKEGEDFWSTWRTKTLRILRVNARTWGISEKIRKPRFSIEDLGYWFWTRT